MHKLSIIAINLYNADTVYKKYIPKRFKPKKSMATRSFYIKTYKLFGLKFAELLKSTLK